MKHALAPISPPGNACEELEGGPNSPAKMTTGVTLVSSTIPPEIVLTTSMDKKAPARFSTAEIPTAILGFQAPVAIEVAIALAVSVKPLVQSEASPD